MQLPLDKALARCAGKRYKTGMKRTRIHALSLGCPKNRVDTERLLGALPGGVKLVDSPEEAQVVLVNTCAFIDPAVEESITAILELAQDMVPVEPRPLFVVAGCLPARYGEELQRELPEVDLWLQPGEVAPFVQALAAEAGVVGRVPSTPQSYGYLKIGEGCDHACRYCIIPKLRGRLRSEDDAIIEREARQLLERGAKELVLVAQDVAAHGTDRGDSSGLIRLLDRLLPLPGLHWLRLLYLYPAGITDELLAFLKAAGPPFVPYFDIPLQHVHPEVLRRMHRPAQAPAEDVVARVRATFPQAALRTSLIVGFPGETDAQFQALHDFVATQRMRHVGVFPYHAEEGTAAEKMPDQVEEHVKQERHEAVMELQREISRELLEEHIGERMEVLVDAPHGEWPGLHEGRVWFQAPEADGATWISGPGVRSGALVEAEIVEAEDYDLSALA
jgi:ribosomal protein S12 methylthiotransferase